jgi:hypothetical protein
LTKKVGLVLIGSSLILSGCGPHNPPNPEEQPAAVVYDATPHWWYFHSGGGGVYHHYVPVPAGSTYGHTVVSGGRSTGGFKASASVTSVRGGFGAMGHAATAGS